MRRLRWVMCALAAALVAGCNPFAPQFCTLIGCDSGLTIGFDRDLPPGSIVTLDTGGTPVTVECGGAATPCGASLFIEGLRAESVTVRVETPTGTVEEFFQPRYSRSRPTGEDCEPECWNARIEIFLPGDP